MEADKKREIVAAMMSKGMLVNRDTLAMMDSIDDGRSFHDFLVGELNKGETPDFSQLIHKYNQKPTTQPETPVQITPTKNINIQESQVRPEQPKTITENTTIQPLPHSYTPTVEVTFSYQEEPKKREVQDFIGFFTSRYNAIKRILMNRKELQNLTSINRLAQKQQREQAAFIGIITDKQLTKTGKVVLTVEDLTGVIKVIISENSDGFETAKECVLDEVIGIVGMCAGQVVFANNIVLPDIPIFKELKKSPDEAYAMFLGDFHFGSKLFIHEPFKKLIKWLTGEGQSEKQRDIASKTNYIFVTGDLVEGVGIYPGQDEDLDIKDIYDQYGELAKHLAKIPQNKKIIVCAGNHDAMRIAEPQPPLYKDFAEAVWALPNVEVVSNPAYVNIHKSEKFPGFDVLLYHGFSFIYYADQVQSIRDAGGQKRSDLIMKFLLQRRHLAPSHKSTLYLPDTHKDSLVIDKIPDFFASGHIHRTSAATYRNVTLLNCSSWLEMSDYQEKVGLIPQPGRALLVNLQTRKVKILKFYDDPNEKKNE